MINREILNKVKIVLFDFDDTLAVHNKHQEVCSDVEYRAKAYSDSIDPWKDSAINPQLKLFMHLCEQEGKEIGVISAEESHTVGQRKVQWVQEHYDIICGNYCVGSPDAKLCELKAIAAGKHIEPTEILIVDDFWEVLENAANAGFIACTPLEIVNFVNEYQTLTHNTDSSEGSADWKDYLLFKFQRTD